MPAPTNDERADWARAAVEYFYSLVSAQPEDEPLEQKMYDLVADMRHLADAEGLDWGKILDTADMHYEAEVEEEREEEGTSLSGVRLGAVTVAPEVRDVIRLIIDKAPSSYKGAVAKQYAMALLEDPRATESAEAVRVQLMYLRGNLGWWKGAEAKEAKRILDRAIQDLK